MVHQVSLYIPVRVRQSRANVNFYMYAVPGTGAPKTLISWDLFEAPKVCVNKCSVKTIIWTQDGAPAHICKAVQQYLRSKLGSKGFQSKDKWLPAPNLNPLDCSVWQDVATTAGAAARKNVTELKMSVKAAWADMSEEYGAFLLQTI